MMHAKTRRELMDQVVHDYDSTMVKALMKTISEETGISCTEAADIVLHAWQLSKTPHVDTECYESGVAVTG